MSISVSTRIAVKQANKSLFKQRLGATITKGKRILGVGHNEVNRNTKHWAQYWEGSIHAEEAALLQAVKQHGVLELRNSTLHVVRLSKSGHLAMAKPCHHCQELLLRFQIKKVLYSTKDGMAVLVL
jgi:deoxycytidylate deaminase